jgi:hypothetical protein
MRSDRLLGAGLVSLGGLVIVYAVTFYHPPLSVPKIAREEFA